MDVGISLVSDLIIRHIFNLYSCLYSLYGKPHVVLNAT